MLPLSDYTFLEKIHNRGNNQLFRAERRADKKKVFIKLFEHPDSNCDESVHIRSEYEIARNPSFNGIAQILELKSYRNQTIVILDNLEGITLDKYLKQNKNDLAASLRVAI